MYNDSDMGNEEFTRRALSAYFRTADVHPSSTVVQRVGGLRYVVLRRGGKLLACYRIRNDGKLKRLVRIPPSIAK